MKKLFGLLSTCFILLVIISCSNLNETSSLSLTFNGSDFARNSSARNISVSSDYDGYYLVVNLLSDYNETKTIPFSSIGTYTITFDYIPVGAEIYVEANAYNPNVQVTPGGDIPSFAHVFTGTSSKKIISAGINEINLQMKNLKNVTISETTISSSTDYENDASTYNGNFIWTGLNMNFYSNNKYQITNGNSEIISEGLYTGIPEPGNTVTFKECVYKNIASRKNLMAV